MLPPESPSPPPATPSSASAGAIGLAAANAGSVCHLPSNPPSFESLSRSQAARGAHFTLISVSCSVQPLETAMQGFSILLLAKNFAPEGRWGASTCPGAQAGASCREAEEVAAQLAADLEPRPAAAARQVPGPLESHRQTSAACSLCSRLLPNLQARTPSVPAQHRRRRAEPSQR